MAPIRVVNRPIQAGQLAARFKALRGDASHLPDASIVIPVNAQGDLDNVLQILADIADYAGDATFEAILVINNYPPEAEPEAVAAFRAMNLEVVAVPNVRRPGEAVGFTARMVGARAARTENVLLFDADCRIPHATRLINWYVDRLSSGAEAAYTHVAYYGLRNHPSIRFRMFTHHFARWVKRVLLRIPTTRGSNYAFKRTVALRYYDEGLLADELNIGPTIKKRGGRIDYNGAKDLTVLTSGRMFRGGWLKLLRYLLYRLRYNIRVLPGGKAVAQRTKREHDPVRRYVDNVPVRDDDAP